MKCPFCDSKSVRVTDSRSKDSKLYRRRECLECEERFTTYEVDLSMLMEIFEDKFPVETTAVIAEILEKEFPTRNYK